MDMRNTLKTLCQAYGPTGNEGSVAQAVSYTHLDVYKRQAMNDNIPALVAS